MVKVHGQRLNRNTVKWTAEAGQKILGDDDAAGVPSLVPGVKNSKLWNGLGIDQAYWVYYCCTPK